MRRIELERVEPGMTLAKDINRGDVTLIPAGAQLTERSLSKLENFGVRDLFVEAPGFEDLEPAVPLSSGVYLQLQDALQRLRRAVMTVKESGSGPLPVADIKTVVKRLVEDLESSAESFLLYRCGPGLSPGERWVTSTINKAVLVVLLAKARGDVTALQDLALAACLADLGWWKLPGEIRKQGLAAGPEASYAEPDLQQHVQASRQLLSSTPLSAYVTAAVVQHHERLDGSGYPAGLKGDEIYPGAADLSVVDAYVSLLQSKERVLPHQAMEVIMAGGGYEYPLKAVQLFSQLVLPYPVGMEVELNTGERGLVCKVDIPGRPCVRTLDEFQEINLAQEYTRQIVRQFTI